MMEPAVVTLAEAVALAKQNAAAGKRPRGFETSAGGGAETGGGADDGPKPKTLVELHQEQQAVDLGDRCIEPERVCNGESGRSQEGWGSSPTETLDDCEEHPDREARIGCRGHRGCRGWSHP